MDHLTDPPDALRVPAGGRGGRYTVTYAGLTVCISLEADECGGYSPESAETFSGVCYLGYALPLPTAEYYILRTLIMAAVPELRSPQARAEGSLSSDPARLPVFVDVPTLLARMREGDHSRAGAGHTMTANELAVLVRRINRISLEVGGRRLIVSRKGLGYAVNPYM